MEAQVREIVSDQPFTEEQKDMAEDALTEYGEVWTGMFLPFVAFDPQHIRFHASILKQKAKELAEAI